jgi:hypothetical protein
MGQNLELGVNVKIFEKKIFAGKKLEEKKLKSRAAILKQTLKTNDCVWLAGRVAR